MKTYGIYILFAVALFTAASCASCRGRGSAAASTEEDNAPTQYTYKVLNVYPHSTDSYTQGLYWHDGYLWEGTGQTGESALKKVILETGEIVKEVPLESVYFGEGIAYLGGRIYQLTWRHGLALVYDAETLDRIGTRNYKGEGWGLTSDGQYLYMSDGSDKIYVIDPETFERKKVVNVTMNGRRLMYVNELEWIDGKIWANVYTTDALVIIDTDTGIVEGVVDLTGILPSEDHRSYTDVLNGIAYDEESGRIFVTGKYWNKLFEIELIEK